MSSKEKLQLLFLLHCKLNILSNISNQFSCKMYGSNYISSTSKPVLTKTVGTSKCCVSCSKVFIFFDVDRSLVASNVSMNKSVSCNIANNPVNILKISEPVISLVMRKPTCSS